MQTQLTTSRRVRGTNDLLPGSCSAASDLERRLMRSFADFGYRQVEFPLLEHTELYLKKGGEEGLPFLFDFHFGNRRLCLRPEMTTSALRLFVENLQHKPRPQRLSFSGPVFRYEKPQRGRYRQFTVAGVELIGAKGPMADAEIIGLACHSLRAVGLEGFDVVIGHLGILSSFLRQLKLEPRFQRMLLIEQETLRTQGLDALRARFRQVSVDISEETLATPAAPSNDSGNGLSALLSGLSRSQAHRAVIEMLDTMQIDLSGNREPADIVDRLLNKLERTGLASEISRAVNFMRELSDLKGPAPAVLAEAERLAAAHGIDGRGTLNQLRAMLDLLAAYEADGNVRLDLGLSRGVPYYTGFLMEVHPAGGDASGQICGGGRYDGLVAALGGSRETAAVGVSFGIERLQLALGEPAAPAGLEPQTLVAGVGPGERRDSIQAASELRRLGVRVELDVRGRSVTRNLQFADRLGVPWVVLVGEKERGEGLVLLKQMSTGKEHRCSVAEAAGKVIRSGGKLR